MAKREIIKKVKEFIKLLENNNLKIEKVYLFGSHVSNKAKETSDIDVAIISPDFGKNYMEEMRLLLKIADKIDFMISPDPYSVEQYENAKQGDFLWQEIIQKGKLIKI